MASVDQRFGSFKVYSSHKVCSAKPARRWST